LDNHAYNNRESFYYYFKSEFLENIGTMLMCILAYVMADAFKYVVLIYENKENHISKVSLYYSLHGFYVVLIFMIFEPDETSYFDYPFIVLIFIGYCLMFFSKYTMHQVVKETEPKNIKFMRKLKHIIEVDLIQSSTEINLDQTYFYESSHQAESEKSVFFEDAMALTISNAHYGNRKR
jgi:hypothetical protein